MKCKLFFNIFFIISITFIFEDKLSGTELDTNLKYNDSLELIDQNTKLKIDYLYLTKSPTKACIRSLIFPGWGQIYVKHYYIAPFVFGATGFLWYNIISNQIKYQDFKKDINKIDDKNSYQYQVAHSKMINAVDNRDLSILYLMGTYLIPIIDAYSGAHLYDFEAYHQNVVLNWNAKSDILGNFYFSLNVSIKIK